MTQEKVSLTPVPHSELMGGDTNSGVPSDDQAGPSGVPSDDQAADGPPPPGWIRDKTDGKLRPMTRDEQDEEECPVKYECALTTLFCRPEPDENKQDPVIALSGSKDKTLKLWSVKPGWQPYEGPGDTFISTLEGHKGSVFGLVADFVGGEAVSCSSDETVKTWDLNAEKCGVTLGGHEDAVNGVSADFVRREAISGAFDRTVRLWDLRARACVAVLTGHAGAVNSVAADFGRGEAVSASDDGELWLWDLRAQTRRLSMKGHKSSVLSVVADFDRGEALTGSSDRFLRLWDLKTGACMVRMHGHGRSVNALSADFGRGQAISGSDDGEMRLWNIREGSCTDLVGHQQTLDEKGCIDTYRQRSLVASVLAVAANFERGQAITAGSGKGDIRLWDVDLRRQEGRTIGHKGQVFAVAADFTRGQLGGMTEVD